jgi:putative spermidine/putrescine transport system permease protein
MSVFLPFMVLSILAALQTISSEMRSAAASLGASPLTIATTIDIPLAVPGIVGGVLIVFALNIGSFVTQSMLGGTHGTVLAYQAVSLAIAQFDLPLSSVIAVILVAVASFLAYLNVRVARQMPQPG